MSSNREVETHWPQGLARSLSISGKKGYWPLFPEESLEQSRIGRKPHTSADGHFLSWEKENEREAQTRGHPRPAGPQQWLRAPPTLPMGSWLLSHLHYWSGKVCQDRLNNYNFGG